jgi:SAM-dependent methyltransferase
MDLKETYNRIAEEWHRDHQADDWWIEGTNRFISLLPKGGLVLDAGCGGGTKSAYLIDRGMRVIGIDFSEKLIEIARREVPQAEFRALDMKEAGALPEVFDGIFAQASFLHIPKKELQTVIDGLVTRLTEGGILYAAVKGMREDGPEEEIKEENDYGYSYQRFFSYYTMDELKQYFKNAGLEIMYEDVQKTGKSDWLQLIGKKL